MPQRQVRYRTCFWATSWKIYWVVYIEDMLFLWAAALGIRVCFFGGTKNYNLTDNFLGVQTASVVFGSAITVLDLSLLSIRWGCENSNYAAKISGALRVSHGSTVKFQSGAGPRGSKSWVQLVAEGRQWEKTEGNSWLTKMKYLRCVLAFPVITVPVQTYPNSI